MLRQRGEIDEKGYLLPDDHHPFPAGLGLLLLANRGFLTLGQPYVVDRGPALYPAAQPVVVVQVNVVPMDSERVLANHTVLVRDGLIERIGPAAEVAVPAEARVV